MLAPPRGGRGGGRPPPPRNRQVQREDDRDLDAARHLIAGFFRTLMQARAIANRQDTTARTSLAAISSAATAILLT